MLHRMQFMAALVFIPAMAAAVSAHEAEKLRPIISVSGEGEATAPPDMATIRTGVVSQAETARQALDQNNVAMDKILSLLEQHGIAEKDVQTSNFNVSPVYEHDEHGRREARVVAYRVQNEVQVHVRNLASLGEVLDTLVSAGSNQISGIAFDVDDPTGILHQARGRAIRDAKSRAEVYAQAADAKVGPVLQISEQPIDRPRPMQFGAELRVASAQVPVATGEQEFRVTINVVYELQWPDGE